MTQSDGCFKEDGALSFRFKKEMKISRCKYLLRQADIPFVEHAYPRDNSTGIMIPARSQPMYLRMFHDKTYGMWLLNESADIFFDELKYWDGSQSVRNCIQLKTTY